MNDPGLMFVAVIVLCVLFVGLIFGIGYLAHALWDRFCRWGDTLNDAGCCHSVQSDSRWTQDGWVTVCLQCREWLYHGDDYEARP